jgi:hypothetical protein
MFWYLTSNLLSVLVTFQTYNGAERQCMEGAITQIPTEFAIAQHKLCRTELIQRVGFCDGYITQMLSRLNCAHHTPRDRTAMRPARAGTGCFAACREEPWQGPKRRERRSERGTDRFPNRSFMSLEVGDSRCSISEHQRSFIQECFAHECISL